MGHYFRTGFSETLAGKSQLRQLRQKGLMIGIELDQLCPELVQEAASKGLLINVTAGNVIRLLPPLIMTKSQSDQVIDTVSSLIH